MKEHLQTVTKLLRKKTRALPALNSGATKIMKGARSNFAFAMNALYKWSEIMNKILSSGIALIAAGVLSTSAAQAETLRLLTWGAMRLKML